MYVTRRCSLWSTAVIVSEKNPTVNCHRLTPSNQSSQVKKVGTLWVNEHRVHLRQSQNLGDGWQFKKTLKELFCFLCSSLTWCSVLRVDSIIVHFATCCCVNIWFFFISVAFGEPSTLSSATSRLREQNFHVRAAYHYG